MLRKKINGFQQAKLCAKSSKMINTMQFLVLEVIMEENLKILVLNYSATSLGSIKKIYSPITL